MTIETEVNENSKSTNEMILPWLVGSLVLSCRYKRFLFNLGSSSRHSSKYFFPHHTLFPFLCPHRPASWAGSRAGLPVSQYLSLVLITTVLCSGATTARVTTWRTRSGVPPTPPLSVSCSPPTGLLILFLSLRIRIRDPKSGAFLTPGSGIWDPVSGMGKKSGWIRNTAFSVKYLLLSYTLHYCDSSLGVVYEKDGLLIILIAIAHRTVTLGLPGRDSNQELILKQEGALTTYLSLALL